MLCTAVRDNPFKMFTRDSQAWHCNMFTLVAQIQKPTSTIPIHKINMLMHLNDSQIIYKYVAPKAKI